VEKDRFFFNKKEMCLKEDFLSVCFPLDGVSFEHLPVPSGHNQREKIKK
jgi:hypothetical protein